jgi:uncharacterized zinc-type alcohol dehydrogenase-like protein
MSTFTAYAADAPKGELKAIQLNLGDLHPEHVEIAVEYCGICHSDLSMLNNEWGMTTYPFVPGHEIIGRVAAVGDQVKGVQVGQRVGLGWFAESCMTCHQCMGGDHNLCGTGQATIVGRHGGFADRVRAHWGWVLPLPEALDPAKAGPLLCGGITVFNPLLEMGVLPTHRVGVIGIGGLGHLAIQFLAKWGCEVTAFSTSDAKTAEAKALGAHHVVNTRDESQLKRIAGSLDFILSTVNATVDWQAYLQALAPKGRLHVVGAALEPIPVPAFGLIMGQKSVSGSPLGSPTATATMLEFCARHRIAPVTETFPIAEVNAAMAHLESGKARYRVVLEMPQAK